ncbi:MAG TPA: imidazolonepropionase [Stellaceae bacterium]|nr:imidazolonepropionase [Stellaceae bacterium]
MGNGTETRTDIWENARLATMVAGGAPYGTVEDGALAIAGDRIAWVGARRDLPSFPGARRHDAEGCWVTPGLIDCHTHLVFAGDRSGEFERRLQGASYEEIAREGGGIRASVAATRAAGEDALYAASARRLERLLAEGVTTVEIKSGYGLDLDSEAKMLRVARRLGAALPVTVRTSFLGAHALPPEFDGRQGDYVALVAGAMLDQIAAAGLADAVDAFCERIAFSPAETATIFAAARARGLPVKLHADQLSDQGGAALAARFGALSADHLEYASEAGIAAMAASGTVAVLLPAAFYFLRETKRPPVDWLRRHGVPIALAGDCNPGSSPLLSPLLVLNMACTLFGLTPEEALAGMTRNGARALGLADRGTLATGQRADFALWEVSRPAELAYWLGGAPLRAVVQGGKLRRHAP